MSETIQKYVFGVETAKLKLSYDKAKNKNANKEINKNETKTK